MFFGSPSVAVVLIVVVVVYGLHDAAEALGLVVCGSHGDTIVLVE